ncbi:hypothetical protein HUW51_21195 [Adhaeribacter swui]|uniref:Uncharacterized protein n=1 Tax=Adhaeribacter swui TaxID=2086471 RepID=A0A7G7GD77_9BACT|nr:hypothetical protein [Adhaeribacter swui]QNF35111.1 hypothetical protein HUW51_21195 [Adhaeribacter swui]
MKEVNQTKSASTGWINTGKDSAATAGSNQVKTSSEEKIVSRVTFEQDPYAQVSFNTYQAILDSRNQMLGSVKPSLYNFDAE